MVGRPATRCVFAVGVVAASLVGSGPSLAAAQVSVDCGAGANLQAAINAAKPGTILAISGTCHGAFTVGKNLVLKGASAAVLDAEAAGTTLTVTQGKVRVTKMMVTGGQAEDTAAAILNLGTLTLIHVTVSGNGVEGDTTGGIENQGTMTVQRSLFRGNEGDDTGGISNHGTATVDHTTVSLNGGNGITSSGSLTLTDSTVSGNVATYFGGIENSGALTVVRSTIARNNAFNADGAGIVNGAGGVVSVVQSTISGNRADEFGGGILNYGPGSVTITATILAANTDESDERQSDCIGTIISGGYNVIGVSCGAVQSTDRVGTESVPLDAMLKALGNYGGPTQTMVPRPASPAVNAIPVGVPGAVCPPSGTTDQRGIARPQSGACDIGSVERKPKE